MHIRKKYVALLIFTLIVAVVILATVRSLTYSSTLTIEVAPSSSIIKVDNRVVKEGVTEVKPGLHTVVIDKSGFTKATRSVDLKPRESSYVGVVLSPNTAPTANWYNEHPEDQKKAESISSYNFDDTVREGVKAAPFIKKLPFIGPGLQFRIDYGFPNGSNEPAIYIQASSEEGRQNALKWIKAQGFDPSKMKIVYKDPDEPRPEDRFE